MLSTFKFSFVFISLIFLAGCGSTIEVVPLSKGAKEVSVESGIPYYLPMPCMLVTKNLPITRTIIQSSATAAKQEKTENSKKDQAAGVKIINQNVGEVTIGGKKAGGTEDHYEFQIIYLPDIDKLYGIKISKGTGTFKSKITLEDGWKLTDINAESDAKTSDIITAAGDAVPSIISAFSGFNQFKGGHMLDPFAKKQTEKPCQELWIYRIGAGGSLQPIFYWSSGSQK